MGQIIMCFIVGLFPYKYNLDNRYPYLYCSLENINAPLKKFWPLVHTDGIVTNQSMQAVYSSVLRNFHFGFHHLIKQLRNLQTMLS